MRAVMIKSHVTLTSDRATMAEQVVPSVHVFGGLALNYEVGGLNPVAVESALRMQARQIWMPTKDAANNRRVKGGSGGISLLDDDGNLQAPVLEILALISESDAILGTGHISTEETFALVRQARLQRVDKILITHPESPSSWMQLNAQRELADEGVLFERCYYSSLIGGAPVEEIAGNIRRIGVASTVLATDLGQTDTPSPVEGMRIYLAQLVAAGISVGEITRMAGEIPARLLDLA